VRGRPAEFPLHVSGLCKEFECRLPSLAAVPALLLTASLASSAKRGSILQGSANGREVNFELKRACAEYIRDPSGYLSCRRSFR
jgi:hypothetical protein